MSKLINENCIVFDMEGSKKDIIRTLSGELYRAEKSRRQRNFIRMYWQGKRLPQPLWDLTWAFPTAKQTMCWRPVYVSDVPRNRWFGMRSQVRQQI